MLPVSIGLYPNTVCIWRACSEDEKQRAVAVVSRPQTADHDHTLCLPSTAPSSGHHLLGDICEYTRGGQAGRNWTLTVIRPCYFRERERERDKIR